MKELTLGKLREYTKNLPDDYNVKISEQNYNLLMHESESSKKVNSIMKFYEFTYDYNGFGYYALIGAGSQEEAVAYYEKYIANRNKDDATPKEITKEEAREKFINICEIEKDWGKTKINDEYDRKIKVFDRCCTCGKDPYIVLEGCYRGYGPHWRIFTC